MSVPSFCLNSYRSASRNSRYLVCFATTTCCRVGVCGIDSLEAAEEREPRMTMPWGVAVCVVDMVWAVLAGWVSICLVVANEVARGMRSGEIGPFVVG